MFARRSVQSRSTAETEVSVVFAVEGSGKIRIDTGIPFFDHMLGSFAAHGGFDLEIAAKGDLSVDCHHTVEDVGIVLGRAFAEAMGDKKGIARFGSFYVPMDEALAFAAVDISGRPYLVFDDLGCKGMAGAYDFSCNVEFMRAFAFNAGITLHARAEYGTNPHHITEAVFKAVGRALRAASSITGGGIPSTKGML